MAKITIAGNAVVITSALKLADIRKIAKYRPEALVLKGGEDGTEPVFAIGIGESGRFNQCGAEFSGETHDNDKLATITCLLNASECAEDPREAIAEALGKAILNLNKLESKLPAVLEEIEAEKSAVLDNITIAQ